jgi:two-component system, OmpR family, alkaline phosphatase synthesis response regulator PhoP
MSISKSLLIVDDESSIRWIIKVAFENDNVKIFEASTGEEGVDIALQISPDLIIMDYKLPGINGWETAKRIKKELPNSIIIGHTAYAGEEDKKNAISAGCKEVLEKPVDLDKWENVITSYLSK